MLERGRVAASGAPEDVLVPELLLRVFGVRAHCSVHPLTGRRLLAFAPGLAYDGLNRTDPAAPRAVQSDKGDTR